MSKGITQSAIIVLSFATDTKLTRSTFAIIFSKTLLQGGGFIKCQHSCCIHCWLAITGSGLEYPDPGFVSAIKCRSSPAATQTSTQWSSARSESWPRLPIKCHQLSPALTPCHPHVWGEHTSIMMSSRHEDVGVNVILVMDPDQSYLDSIRVLMRGW